MNIYTLVLSLRCRLSWVPPETPMPTTASPSLPSRHAGLGQVRTGEGHAVSLPTSPGHLWPTSSCHSASCTRRGPPPHFIGHTLVPASAKEGEARPPDWSLLKPATFPGSREDPGGKTILCSCTFGKQGQGPDEALSLQTHESQGPSHAYEAGTPLDSIHRAQPSSSQVTNSNGKLLDGRVSKGSLKQHSAPCF